MFYNLYNDVHTDTYTYISRTYALRTVPILWPLSFMMMMIISIIILSTYFLLPFSHFNIPHFPVFHFYGVTRTRRRYEFVLKKEHLFVVLIVIKYLRYVYGEAYEISVRQ